MERRATATPLATRTPSKAHISWKPLTSLPLRAARDRGALRRALENVKTSGDRCAISSHT